MKASKIATRFFEENDKQRLDNFLFVLFQDWRDSIKPDIRLECEVYLILFDIREYLDMVFCYVRSGQPTELGFFLLDHTNAKRWARVIDKLTQHWKIANTRDAAIEKEVRWFSNDPRMLFWDLMRCKKR